MSYPGRSHGLHRQTPGRPSVQPHSEAWMRVCVQAGRAGRAQGTAHTHTASTGPGEGARLESLKNITHYNINNRVELTEQHPSINSILRGHIAWCFSCFQFTPFHSCSVQVSKCIKSIISSRWYIFCIHVDLKWTTDRLRNTHHVGIYKQMYQMFLYPWEMIHHWKHQATVEAAEDYQSQCNAALCNVTLYQPKNLYLLND